MIEELVIELMHPVRTDTDVRGSTDDADAALRAALAAGRASALLVDAAGELLAAGADQAMPEVHAEQLRWMAARVTSVQHDLAAVLDAISETTTVR